MNASQPSNASTSPEASSPSHPMLTMVGLGPPPPEEPLLAGTTAYVEEDSVPPSQQRTFVGIPGAPELNLYDATELDDMPNEAITTVMSYDEVTVVTRMPVPREARPLPSDPLAAAESLAAASPLAGDESDDAPFAANASIAADKSDDESLAAAAPLAAGESAKESPAPDAPLAADAPLVAGAHVEASAVADALLASLTDNSDDAPEVPNVLALPVDAPTVEAPPVEPLAKAENPANHAAPELVEPEPEIKLFPPSLDSLVPPRWTLDIPLLSPSAKPSTTSEAPWFVSVETPKLARFPRAHHIVLAALAVGAVALGAVALRPSTGRVLVTVGGPRDVAVSGAVVYVDGERACAPAPCRVTVPFGSHLVGVDAPSYQRPVEKAVAVGRGSEEALHFTLQPEAAVETPAPPPAPVAEAPNVEPPSAEVVSVGDLRVRPDAVKPSLGVQPARVSGPVLPHDIDLDHPSENNALVSSKITMTSNPPCNVVLDGRPLGMTPREVTVSAGAHSVIFIHPDKGRKTLRVETVGGKTAVASVTF